MKGKKLISGLLVGTATFAMAISSVFAEPQQDIINSDPGYETNKMFDTSYDATAYEEPADYYNIEVNWFDLNWIFVYGGSITNPTSYRWITSQNYSELSANEEFEDDENNFKNAILYDEDYYNQHLTSDIAFIDLQNNSNFAISTTASVEEKENIENYDNSAALQIASYDDSDEMENDLQNPESISYNTTATVSNIGNSDSAHFLIKPTATKYVNDYGYYASVEGEVKLFFTKYTE